MEYNLFATVQEAGAAGVYSPRARRKRQTSQRRQHSLIAKRIKEVIYGQRPFYKVYSKTLQTDIWFVNEGMLNPDEEEFNGTIITMEMLSGILSDEKPLLPALEALLN